MNRRRVVVLVLVAVGAAAFFLYACYRRAAWERAAPAWLDPKQPPDGVASQLPTLTDAQSWAANRCRPMAASCCDNTAGRRIRRTYPGSLAESPDSFVRGRLGFGVTLGGGG